MIQIGSAEPQAQCVAAHPDVHSLLPQPGPPILIFGGAHSNKSLAGTRTPLASRQHCRLSGEAWRARSKIESKKNSQMATFGSFRSKKAVTIHF